MGYYINCIKSFDTLQRDIKELIPMMNMRRRMSRIIKMGVCTAMEALLEFESEDTIDAIITATGFGCLADSEKFLANIITSEEQSLNPTPFIQSTFNTIGAQVALIKGLHCYNNTFAHRYHSFESAIIDGMIQLDNGAKAVLICVFDEAIPVLETVMKRLGKLKDKNCGEGAFAFVMTKERYNHSIAEITDIVFDAPKSKNAVSVSETSKTVWSCAVAQVLFDLLKGGTQEFDILNDTDLRSHSLIKVKCL